MARNILAPGYRFQPTHNELIMYYLNYKVTGKELLPDAKRAVSELNILQYSPWDLPGKSSLQSRDLEWYFFCPRELKYASGSRTKRATEKGFWKATGNDRKVTHDGRTVGKIKTLIFYKGHSPKGVRTNWVIHEYRMEDEHLADAGIAQDAYVLCKVFKKAGDGPKNGSRYGAPFRPEDWENVEVSAEPDLSGVSPAMPATTDCQSLPVVTSTVDLDSTSSFTLFEPGPSSARPRTSEVSPDDDVCDLLHPSFTEDTAFDSNNSETISNLNQTRSVGIGQNNDADIFNGLGDIFNGEGRSSFSNSWAAQHPPHINLIPQDETLQFGLIDPIIPLNDNTDTAYLELNDLDKPLYATPLFGLIDPMIPLNDNTNTPYLELNDVDMPLNETLPSGLIDPMIPLNDNIDTAYLELNDLERPLYDSNYTSETQHNFTSSYSPLIDVEQSHNISGFNQNEISRNG